MKVILVGNSDFGKSNTVGARIYPVAKQLKNPIIDTMELSRAYLKDSKRHRLGNLAKKYKVSYEEGVAHRADYDARVLANVYIAMIDDVSQHDVATLQDLHDIQDEHVIGTQRGFHVNILVKNQIGLRDLFKVVSISHTDHLYGSPKLLRRLIQENRDN